MDTIIVGVDGSNGARAATQWVADYSQHTDRRVVAVFAIPRSGLWEMSAAQINIDKVLAEFRELLDGRWTSPLRAADVEYTTQVIRGDPATQLLGIAKRKKASLIVLGSKSHSSLADLIVGGTVHKVINRSDIPVVLVPALAPEKRTASPRKRTKKL